MAKQKAYIELTASIAKLTSDLNKAQALVASRVKAMSASVGVGLTSVTASMATATAGMGAVAVTTSGVVVDGYSKISKSVKKISKEVSGWKEAVDSTNKPLKETYNLFKKIGKQIKASGAKVKFLAAEFLTLKAAINKVNRTILKTGAYLSGIGKKMRIGDIGAGFSILGRQVGAFAAKIGGKLWRLGKTATKVGAVMAAAFVGIGVKMAMDFQEAETFFGKTFGNMSKDVRKWSETMQKKLGVSADGTRKFASTLNTMIKSMGLGEEESKNMSKRLVELTYDLRSARNVPVEEAFNKIRTAMTGTSKGMKDLGYIVDEETVKNYAYANGIAKQGKALTAQQKVLARYQVMLKATGEVHGDLEDTADSTTNTLRRVQNNFSDLTREIGNEFMPVFHEFLIGFDEFIKDQGPAMKTIAREIAQAFGALPETFEIIDEAISKRREKSGKKWEQLYKDPFDYLVSVVDPIGATLETPFIYLDNLLKNSAKYTVETTKEILKGKGKKISFEHTTLKESYKESFKKMGTTDVAKELEKIDKKYADIKEKREQKAHDKAMKRLAEKEQREIERAEKQAEKDKLKAQRIADNLAAEKKAEEERKRREEAEKNRELGMRKFVGRFGGTEYHSSLERKKDTLPIFSPMNTLFNSATSGFSSPELARKSIGDDGSRSIVSTLNEFKDVITSLISNHIGLQTRII